MAYDTNWIIRKVRDWIVRGVQISPGSDEDVDLLRVDVTGSPKIWWDESEDKFAASKAFTSSSYTHGDQSGGTLHADVVAGGDDGFMTGTDKTKLDGIETAATTDQTKADIDALDVDADTLDGNDWTAPGPIGGTTAGTGKFTNVEITGAPASPPAANTIYKDSIIKGWIKFDGTAVTADNDLTGVDDSFNVSGVVDHGTGDHTVYWDKDFSGTDYCVMGMAGSPGGGGNNFVTQDGATPVAGSTRFFCVKHDGTKIDSPRVYITAIGDQ